MHFSVMRNIFHTFGKLPKLTTDSPACMLFTYATEIRHSILRLFFDVRYPHKLDRFKQQEIVQKTEVLQKIVNNSSIFFRLK